MTVWHLLGILALWGLQRRAAWEEAHPVIAPPRTLDEAAHRLAAAWWTQREMALWSVCEARVVSWRPRRDEQAIREREARLEAMTTRRRPRLLVGTWDR